MSGIWNYSGMLAKEYMACMTAVTGLWLNIMYLLCIALGSPIIDGIFLVQKLCCKCCKSCHVANMMHHKLTALLNWTACNQYSCNNHYRRINTHFLNQKYTINYWAT